VLKSEIGGKPNLRSQKRSRELTINGDDRETSLSLEHLHAKGTDRVNFYNSVGGLNIKAGFDDG
jgi:hypothetical protein